MIDSSMKTSITYVLLISAANPFSSDCILKQVSCAVFAALKANQIAFLIGR